MNIPGSWFFYWIIAAVVLAPIVLIVKGVMAGKREAAGTPPKPGNRYPD